MGNCTSGGGSGAGGKNAQSGKIITSDRERTIEVEVTKKNKKAPNVYSKQVLAATVDEYGNVMFTYPNGSYSGNYGDAHQTVTYKLKAGAADGETFGINLKNAETISGQTYQIKKAAKEAGLQWNEKAKAWTKKDHWSNTKTDYSESDLQKMSNKQLRQVFDASHGKYRLYMGDSLGDIAKKLDSRKDKKAEKDFMIKAIKDAQKYIK